MHEQIVLRTLEGTEVGAGTRADRACQGARRGQIRCEPVGTRKMRADALQARSDVALFRREHRLSCGAGGLNARALAAALRPSAALRRNGRLFPCFPERGAAAVFLRVRLFPAGGARRRGMEKSRRGCGAPSLEKRVKKERTGRSFWILQYKSHVMRRRGRGRGGV